MALYIDTEFNGFRGSLISMGIVSSCTEDSFYEVRKTMQRGARGLHPWVFQNVLPVLNKEGIEDDEFQAKLWAFMRAHQGEVIFADWPEDFAHLMSWMCGTDGMRPRMEFQLITLDTWGKDTNPSIPHNALSDADALMRWHQDVLEG